MSTATGASPRPITMMTGPTTIGGNIFMIHLVPIPLIISAISTYRTPEKNKAVSTSPSVFAPSAMVIGRIKAKLDPR